MILLIVCGILVIRLIVVLKNVFVEMWNVNDVILFGFKCFILINNNFLWLMKWIKLLLRSIDFKLSLMVVV